MNVITREDLIAYAAHEVAILERALLCCPDSEVIQAHLQLACIALASLEAEPGKAREPSRLSFSREQPVSVVVDDVVWKLFSVNFVHDGRHFSFGFYATSRHHAAEMLADIRETAVLDEYDLVAFSSTPPDDITLAELERLSADKIQ